MSETINNWQSKIFLKFFGRKLMLKIQNAQFFLSKKNSLKHGKDAIDKLEREINFCMFSSIGLSLLLMTGIQRLIPYYRSRINLITMSIDLGVMLSFAAGGIVFAINSCQKEIGDLTKNYITEMDKEYLVQMQLYRKKYGMSMLDQIQPYLTGESAEKWTKRAAEILA